MRILYNCLIRHRLECGDWSCICVKCRESGSTPRCCRWFVMVPISM